MRLGCLQISRYTALRKIWVISDQESNSGGEKFAQFDELNKDSKLNLVIDALVVWRILDRVMLVIVSESCFPASHSPHPHDDQKAITARSADK